MTGKSDERDMIVTESLDGIDRRGFLKCMAWAGTGTFCLLQGGVLKSFALDSTLQG